MPYVERAGRSIHFTLDGEGPGVVLVPGLGSGARLFGTLPRRFTRAGFTCAVMDPVGLPPSGPAAGPWTFPDAAADLIAIAARLPRPVSLVGTSLGGKVALTAAALDPAAVDRVVMLCSSAIQTPRSRRIHRWFELLCTETPPMLLGELTAPFLFGATFQAERRELVEDIVRSTKPSPESLMLMREQCAALQDFDGGAMARNCSVPTLCLGGAEDTLTLPAEVEASARLFPRAQHHSLPRAGHSLLLESAEAFERVTAFLRHPAC